MTPWRTSPGKCACQPASLRRSSSPAARRSATAARSARCRAELIEPPTPDRVTEIVRSALHQAEQALLTQIAERVGPAAISRLETLIAAGDDDDEDEDVLGLIKAAPGGRPGERISGAQPDPTSAARLAHRNSSRSSVATTTSIRPVSAIGGRAVSGRSRWMALPSWSMAL